MMHSQLAACQAREMEGVCAAEEELTQLREQVAAQQAELEQGAVQRSDLETALVRAAALALALA